MHKINIYYYVINDVRYISNTESSRILILLDSEKLFVRRRQNLLADAPIQENFRETVFEIWQQ